MSHFRQHPTAFLTRRALCLLACLASLWLPADLTAGIVSGRAFVDYEGNGVIDATEYGVPGITVTAFDGSGAVAGSAVTDFSGHYTLNAAGSGPYRIEFTGVPDHLRPGLQGAAGSSVRFVAGSGASEVNLPLTDPVKFNTAANPPVLVTRFMAGRHDGAHGSAAALMRLPYQATGHDFAGATPTAQFQAATSAAFSDIGAAYGIAHQTTRGRVYVGAYHKRLSGFGPGGPDAIYVFDSETDRLLGVIRLDTLTGVPDTAGADAHNFSEQNGRVYDIGSAGNTNTESFDGVGKRALGDLEMSADMRTLFVVNLFDRKIYALDVSSGDPAQAALLDAWDAPDATRDARHRPFALAVHEGRLWVGSVDENGTNAFVHSFTPDDAEPVFTLELTVPLDYPRQAFIGAANNPNRLADWRAWVSDPSTLTPMTTNAEEIAWPQPMLADIEFDGRDMILGLRDRFGDQAGYAQRFNLASSRDSYPISAGDILRVRRTESDWALEGSAENPTSGGLAHSGPGGAAYPEHYEWDLFNDGALWDVMATGGGLHWETAQGSLLQLAGKSTVMTTAMNPFSDFSGGLLRLENSSGRREGVSDNNVPAPDTGAYTLYEGGDYGALYPADAGFFNEANGLGAIEPLLAPPPIQIGNRVWLDTNGNGIQDAAEAGLGGVVIELHDAAGGLVATTTTASGSDPDLLGVYVFDNLAPESAYVISLSPANFQPGGALAGLRRAPAGNGTALRDSDGVLLAGLTGGLAAWNGRVGHSLATGAPGASDHSIDFGFIPCPAIQIGPPELPHARVGEAYSQTLAASGSGAAAPFVFDLAEGSLPDGLGLDAAGALNGTPGAAGLSSFTVRATDAEGCSGARAWQLRVCPVITLQPGALAQAEAGKIYHAAITVEGGEGLYLFAVSEGALPSGLQLVGNVITGTPDGPPGIAEFSLRVIDVNGCDAERAFQLEVLGKATTWPAWQARHLLEGENGPDDNPDGDRFDNLLEFAFDLDPASGIKLRCPVQVVIDPLTASADVRVLRVTGISGVSYHLETLADLADSPAGWSDVTGLTPSLVFNDDGTEWAVYPDAATLPEGVPSAFFRVRVELDSDLDGTPEAVSRSEAVGVFRRAHHWHIESLSMPFLSCEVFDGAVDSVTGSLLHVGGATGAGSLAAALTASVPYYVEILTGPHAGHRLDIDAANCTAAAIAIDSASLRNTLPVPLSELAGHHIAVRPHQTLDSLLPKPLLNATNSPATASRVLFCQGGSFRYYWLFRNQSNPRWVLDGDATLTDAGPRVIAPSEGLLLHPRHQHVTLLLGGLVRSNAFACPLPRGVALIAGGWPRSQSPAQRAVSTANGFTGGSSSARADRLLFWNGDQTAGAAGYDGYFLLHTGPYNHWTTEQNATLANSNDTPLFQPLRAVLTRSQNGHPTYVQPPAWTP